MIFGEAIAIGALEEYKNCYNEGGSFTLRKFDSTTITIWLAVETPCWSPFGERLLQFSEPVRCVH